MLKSLVIKILAKVFLILGIILRKKRNINLAEIKTILVNKIDRLGDAIVSLPFLLELNKRFDITVFTSKYNDFILKDFLKTKVLVTYPLPFLKVIKMIFKNIVCFKYPSKNLNIPKYDLYLDLNGIKEINIFLKIKEDNLCRYYVDFNLGPWNSLLDYAAKGNSVLFSTVHILDSYSSLLKRSVGIDLEIPDYLDLSSKIRKPDDFDIVSPYILVNISGFDKFRGPTPQMFEEILNQINFKGKFVVMDELRQPNLREFKEYAKRDNIIYIEKDYSVWELSYIAKKSVLYIGSDSGITQLLGLSTNAIFFFANSPPAAWKPYSKHPYQRKKIGKIIIEETKNSVGLIKKIIYLPVWCRPCFDIGCRGYRCIKDMDIKLVSDEINCTLQDILTLFS